MTPAPGFVFVRQEKPSNCAAVALANAARWLGVSEDVERAEDVLAMLDKHSGGGGKDYRAAAGWCQVQLGLDVLLPGYDDLILGPLLPDALSRWVAILDIISPHTLGNRHAIVLADIQDERFLVLDGKTPGPEPWTRDRLRHHGPLHPMLLRPARPEV